MGVVQKKTGGLKGLFLERTGNFEGFLGKNRGIRLFKQPINFEVKESVVQAFYSQMRILGR